MKQILCQANEQISSQRWKTVFLLNVILRNKDSGAVMINKWVSLLLFEDWVSLCHKERILKMIFFFGYYQLKSFKYTLYTLDVFAVQLHYLAEVILN